MLTIIANIQARHDRVDLVRSELEKLIPITRSEEGCIQYDLYEQSNNEDSSVRKFAMIECWESREHLEKHLSAPHIKSFREKNGNKFIKPTNIMLYKSTNL